MDDFRFLHDNALWIIIIALFLLFFFSGNGNSCGGFNLDCIGNLFNGCGNNSWIWIIIAVVVIYYLMNNDCGGFLRNDMQ